MSDTMTRRALLSGLAASAAGTVWAGAPSVSIHPALRPPQLAKLADGGLEGLIARADLPGAVACAVADAETGAPLEAVHGEVAMPPASVAKIVTALYALDRLGPDHRFRTRLLATAPLVDGRLDGDLILAGGGDPTLDTDGLAALAAEAKAAGLREITGRFIVWVGALPYVRSIDPEQPDHLGYSAAVSGIALNFNRVHFGWNQASAGYTVSMDARTGRYRPEVVSARMRVVNRSAPIYTYEQKGGVDHWTVAASALGNGGARWLPVRRPGLYAGDVFATLARSHGIVLPAAEITRRPLAETVTLASLESEPLAPILRDMLKYSNNLTAEMVGLAATAAGGSVPGSLGLSAAEMSVWAAAAYGMTGADFVDHSGLSDQSRISPQALVTGLVEARRSSLLDPLLKPLAVRDADGRVDRAEGLKGAAKTGTLNFVSGLGGYLTTQDGRILAFAIFTADPETRARLTRAQRDRAPGARSWNGRSRRLQHAMLRRWGRIYAS